MSEICVIIPLFNHCEELLRSLKSLAKQTLLPQAVVIVDDGSTDGGAERAAKLHWPFKLVLLRQSNAGAAAARNFGFNNSVGELVTFWDADTIARPEMLQKLAEALAGDATASYAYASYEFGLKQMTAQAFDAESLKQNNYIDTTALVRRSALTDLGGPFDPSLKRFQDWDLWITLLEKGRTGVFVPEVLYKKLSGGRRGMSQWLPKNFYKLFPNSKAVKEYEGAKQIVLKKHGLQ